MNDFMQWLWTVCMRVIVGTSLARPSPTCMILLAKTFLFGLLVLTVICNTCSKIMEGVLSYLHFVPSHVYKYALSRKPTLQHPCDGGVQVMATGRYPHQQPVLEKHQSMPSHHHIIWGVMRCDEVWWRAIAGECEVRVQHPRAGGGPGADRTHCNRKGSPQGRWKRYRSPSSPLSLSPSWPSSQ